MNFHDIKSSIKHLISTSQCNQCKKKYRYKDIHILASTKTEGLFEVRCPRCSTSTIVTVFLTPHPAETMVHMEREHGSISENEVLDMKNFLTGFDGNFKKIFINEK